MRTFAGLMFVLDPSMGQNGLEYGIEANVRKFSFSFQAEDPIWAKILCRQVGPVYDGEIVASYDAGEDPADWWKHD